MSRGIGPTPAARTRVVNAPALSGFTVIEVDGGFFASSDDADDAAGTLLMVDGIPSVDTEAPETDVRGIFLGDTPFTVDG